MGASPSPSPDVEISIGSVLDGRYRIDAILGTGGMGRVYRGEHTGIGRAVAIKVLHADLNRNREAAQRFQREAIASGRLDHPNIVGVSDFGILDDGPCYLVMEALEGESLGARLDREKRIPWREAVEILRGVLAGLRHAHDRGVVHRDIKPDNVFLARKDGESIVKILDFGIAKLYAGSPDDPASTRAGLTVGTPAYLSPEQAVGGEIKPASDLYSATILLFEMITGRAPFEDKDPLAMLGAHVSRPPPPIAEVAPDLDVPPMLEDVIQRGLLKSQAERVSSAADYLGLLDGVIESVRGSRPSLQFLGTPIQGLPTAPAPSESETPSPRTPSPHAPGMTSLLDSLATPPPDTQSALPVIAAQRTPVPGTMVLPTSTRSISLADAPALPRNWIKLGILVIVLALIGAIAVMSIWGKQGSSSTSTSKSTTEPAAPEVSMVPAVLGDRGMQLKAYLHDLEAGETCQDRKAAISGLVQLGDPAAIPALKKARYRMRGGVLGVGDTNTNSCLKNDAVAAVRALGGTIK